ncbi:MAG: T9SS type A sorting domain-containing protein [Chitinophagaceae bacterium]|nr:MAG: T9SS type A sorting domain-containing protein [Chitinophagaceae bacterium]
MVDIDGTFRYSEVRAVKGSGTKADFTVFPNPSYGDANLNITDVSENTEIHVYDNAGRMVRRISNINKTNVSLDNLQKGMYMIRLVDTKTGETVTKKLSVLN